MSNKYFVLLFVGFLFLLFFGLVSAYPFATSGVQYTIGEFVFDNDYNPINIPSCNITIYYPDNTPLVVNVSMNHSSNWNYYNVTLVAPLGLYHALLRCNYSGDYGAIDKSFYLNASVQIGDLGLQVHNPNPGNDSNNTISYALGINTSIDVTYLPSAVGNQLNLSMTSNSTGVWALFYHRQISSNGTYYHYNRNFSNPNTRYFWNVSVRNDTGYYVNHSYWFKTGTSVNYTIYENLANATGSYHVHYSLSDGFRIWNNYTGYNGLTLLQNIVDATGTHIGKWNGTHWNVWANYTGTGGGGGGVSGLLVDNPNPANGTLGYNYLQGNPHGIKTAVDVVYQNFTEINVGNLGTGKLFENNTNYLTDFYIGNSYMRQTFYSNVSFVLHNISLQLKKAFVTSHPRNIYISFYKLSDSTLLYNDTFNCSGLTTSYLWYNFTTPPIVINSGIRYGFYLLADYTTFFNMPMFAASNVNVYSNGRCEHQELGLYWLLDGDSVFKLYGWSIGGNITWNHVVNLTLSSNSSGSWFDYSHLFAVFNGTIGDLNTNMTVNNTRYWWRVNWSTVQPSEAGSDVFTFTTGRMRGVSSNAYVSSYLPMMSLAIIPLLYKEEKKRRSRRK